MAKTNGSLDSVTSSYNALISILSKCYEGQSDEIKLLKEDPKFLAQACEFFITDSEYYNPEVNEKYQALYDNLFNYFENVKLEEPFLLGHGLKLVSTKKRNFFEFDDFKGDVRKIKANFNGRYTDVIAFVDITMKKNGILVTRQFDVSYLKDQMLQNLNKMKKDFGAYGKKMGFR